MSRAYDKITLLDKWRLVQKVVSDPGLSRCAVACGFHLIDLYNKRLDRAWRDQAARFFTFGSRPAIRKMYLPVL